MVVGLPTVLSGGHQVCTELLEGRSSCAGPTVWRCGPDSEGEHLQQRTKTAPQLFATTSRPHTHRDTCTTRHTHFPFLLKKTLPELHFPVPPM
eukprot:3501692-Amphidinium_carterae.1